LGTGLCRLMWEDYYDRAAGKTVRLPRRNLLFTNFC